jgi:hypothetical protein
MSPLNGTGNERTKSGQRVANKAKSVRSNHVVSVGLVVQFELETSQHNGDDRKLNSKLFSFRTVSHEKYRCMAFAKRFLCLCTSTVGSVETVVDMMDATLSMA